MSSQLLAFIAAKQSAFPCEPLKSHSGQRWPMCNSSTWEAETGDFRASFLSGLEE